MPEKLFGIPAHPLMVHLPVVLLPLCGLLALLLAVRPSLVRHYGIPFAVLTGVAFVGTFLATESGEGLEDILGEKSAAIERHAEWGDRTRLIALVFFLLAVVFVAVARRSQRAAVERFAVLRHRLAIPVIAALLCVSAVATTVSVIYTGHTGAKSAWEDAGKEE